MALFEHWGDKYKKAQSYTTLLLHLACKKQLGSCKVINLEQNVLSRVSHVSTRCLCKYGSSSLFSFFSWSKPSWKHHSQPWSRQGLLSIKEAGFKVEDDFRHSSSAFLLKNSVLNPRPNQQWFPPHVSFLVGRKREVLWARIWNEDVTYHRCHLCSYL